MVETHILFSSTLLLLGDCGLNRLLGGPPLSRISNVYGERNNLGSKYDQMYSKVAKIYGKSNRKAMNNNRSNQKPNPALKTKTGNK